MTAILEMHDATKTYAGVPAFQNVNFTLEKGEIHAIVGENGAGKSTLTKVMAGVVTLNGGKMLLEGTEISPKTPDEARKLGIAMVFQENSLVPTMTAAQNLFLGQESGFNRNRAHQHRSAAILPVAAVRRRAGPSPACWARRRSRWSRSPGP